MKGSQGVGRVQRRIYEARMTGEEERAIASEFEITACNGEQKISSIPSLPPQTRGTIPWEIHHSSRATLNTARTHVHSYIKIIFI